MKVIPRRILFAAVGIAVTVLLVGVVLISDGNISLWYKKLEQFRDEIRQDLGQEPLAPKGKELFLPPPLRSEQENERAQLTREGIIAETNQQRIKQGLPALRENAQLNSAAQKKADDMLARQYFAHEASTGEGAQELVEGVGYEFLALGENLAMGNYESDGVLVRAWMDSPGHRENILGLQFSEIGVAAALGIFEGRRAWVAVQEFAKPASACSWPNEELKAQIEANNQELERIEQELVARKQELNRMQAQRNPQYNQKTEEYNNLVSQYSQLLAVTKTMIAQYNAQVVAFNECVTS